MKLVRFFKNIFKGIRKDLPDFIDFTGFCLKQIFIYGAFFAGTWFVGKCVEWCGLSKYFPPLPDGTYPGAFIVGVFTLVGIFVVLVLITLAVCCFLSLKKIWNES